MKTSLDINLPEFTKWIDNYLVFGPEKLKATGIYIHGTPNTRKKKMPVDPFDSCVDYIGVATNNFRTRMDKFYGTLENGFDHSRGSYNHTGARVALSEGLKSTNFCSALCIIEDPTEAKMIERVLIYLYKQKHGRVPRFNDTPPKKN